MPRFMVIHTAPWTEANLNIYLVSKLPRGFSWKSTYCDFADNKFFCEWEAPSKEVLEDEFKTRKIPFDAVYPVQIFNVLKGKLEK